MFYKVYCCLKHFNYAKSQKHALFKVAFLSSLTINTNKIFSSFIKVNRQVQLPQNNVPAINFLQFFKCFDRPGSRWCMVRWSPHWYQYRGYKCNFKSDVLFSQNNFSNGNNTSTKIRKFKSNSNICETKKSFLRTWFQCMRLIKRENSLIQCICFSNTNYLSEGQKSAMPIKYCLLYWILQK